MVFSNVELGIDNANGAWYNAITDISKLLSFLRSEVKKVEIITPFPMVGINIGFTHQPVVWPRLRKKGIMFRTSAALKKISGRTLIVSDVFSEEEYTIEGVDTVVIATEYRANDSLYRALKGQVKKLYGVGDCLSPRRVLDAIHEGYKVGLIV